MTDFTEMKRDVLSTHLRKQLRGEVRFDPMSRQLYSTDASIYRIEPLGVVIPKSTDDVAITVQIAGEMGVPIIARGGGTSLSGQSIGPGIVLDLSKYLNNILEIDPVRKVARVQPGVVLDQFNRALSEHNLQFGPEVSTASRANLGGMIGNNSAGSRSIIYGKTIDHVNRLRAVLSDGSRAEFGPLTAAEWDRKSAPRTLEGGIYRYTRQIVQDAAGEIRRRFPRIIRRVSGYNLDVLLRSFEETSPTVNLSNLLVGSEGTLAISTEAEVKLVDRPKSRGLLVAHFDSLESAMDAVAPCLESQPSAVELLDQMLLDLAKGNLSLRDTMAAVHGRPATILMVEFFGDTPAEVSHKVEQLKQRLHGGNGVTELVPAIEPALRDPLWNLRTAAAALLYTTRGDRKPIAFVEDPAVPPARLPEFSARFRSLLREHGTDGAFYGHASVGCLHIRPLINLKDPKDVATMRRISEAVTDLVLEFGGSLSGEHGDGLARSEWNRKMFGPVVYQAFCRIKEAFDPQNLLNPGKVVNAPAMTENLRFGSGYQPAEPATLFDYDKQEGLVRSIELCNGSGACRKLEGGAMCPSFRATRDEKDSTRGRANALRLALAGEEPLKNLRSRAVHDVLDLCLMCKACKSECPSNVDMAKLKSEFLHFYYENKTRPLGQILLANLQRLNGLGSLVAPVANWLQERRTLRWFMERIAGIDRRRTMPHLHFHHFRRWFARRKPAAGPKGKVLLLDDCFTTFYEPNIGQSAVRVLEHAGYQVELAGSVCCGRPLISKGFLKEARELIQHQAHRLAGRLSADTPLLTLEPSCYSAIADDWPELLPGANSKKIAAHTDLADHWLVREVKEKRLTLDLSPRKDRCLLHPHCHQRALRGPGGSADALKLIPGLEVTTLDAGCCGMAGSFGFEEEHYDLSVQIANLALLPALAAAPDSTISATGTSCRHQIGDLAGRKSLHPLEMLCESLPSANPSD